MFKDKTVGLILPTYNEKDSIAEVIFRFEKQSVFDEIIVVNNNAVAGTSEEVQRTSATEVHEKTQGYGAAIMKGLSVAKQDLLLVCEPDATFEEEDVFKFLEYSRDFDVVYGSRTMNDLIWDGANMGWFLRFGNFSVAKLMELLFNSCSLSDVGCTYRLLRQEVVPYVLEKCKVLGEYFGPEMMIATIRNRDYKVVQIPINYKERVGTSSVTGKTSTAIVLGLKMILLIMKKRFSPA